MLDRVRARWWLPVVVGVLLTWALVADLLVLYEAVLPLAAVCAIRMYRRRGPLAGQWYELSLAAAALGSAVAARLAVAQIGQAGGFTARTLLARFSTSGELSAHLWDRVQGVLGVFGADIFGQPIGPGLLLDLVRLVAVVLVGWAVAAAVRRFYGEADLVTQLLAAAFVVVVTGYLFTNKGATNGSSRLCQSARCRGPPAQAAARLSAPPGAGAGPRLRRRYRRSQPRPPASVRPQRAGRGLAPGPSPHLWPGRILGSEQRHRGQRRPGQGQARPDVPPSAGHDPVGDQRVMV